MTTNKKQNGCASDAFSTRRARLLGVRSTFRMYLIDDESIRFEDGRLAFVSLNRFQEKVLSGDYCLVCAEKVELSSREHIIPDWLLRKMNLYGKNITLGNRTQHRYGQYVIPCCLSCNGFMGNELEEPISSAFEAGFGSFVDFYKSDSNRIKLFAWLSFLFTKSHYKDLFLSYERDQRVNSGSIAQELEYDWGDMHHIYCLARSPFTRANIHPEALGSLVAVPIQSVAEREPFDIIDLTHANTIGIRVDDVGVIAVFGDGRSVLSQIDANLLQRISGPLSFPQFRELVAHFACCKLHLKNPPQFASYPNMFGDETIGIACSSKDTHPQFEDFNPRVLGGFLEMLLYHPMKEVIEDPEFFEDLKNGTTTFLFDDNGNFIENASRGNET